MNLLQEIASLSDAVTVHPKKKGEQGLLPSTNQPFTVLGKGIESVVYKTPDNPNVIKILAKYHNKLDPYSTYVYLIHKYGQHNSLFPKIIKKKNIRPTLGDKAVLESLTGVRKYRRRHHELRFVAFEIEPLVEINTLSRDQKDELLEKTFSKEHLAYISEGERDRPSHTIADAISDVVSSWSSQRREKFIQHREIAQLCNVVRFLMTKYKTSSDIHDENIMARITPDGPELVVIDPIYVD